MLRKHWLRFLLLLHCLHCQRLQFGWELLT
jgi:hypothetical protein